MADRPKGFGTTVELPKMRVSKFDPNLAAEAADWIEAVNGQPGAIFTEPRPFTPESFSEPLKDGSVLCALINNIKPGSVKKINTSKKASKTMENIGNFLTACEGVGVNKADMFQTVDLYEQANIPQVVNGIFALGRKAQKVGYAGPRLGPEEATSNKREFTEEQLRAGEGVIGLQAGSNKGASQAGQNFGKTRAIID